MFEGGPSISQFVAEFDNIQDTAGSEELKPYLPLFSTPRVDLTQDASLKKIRQILDDYMETNSAFDVYLKVYRNGALANVFRITT